MMKLFPLMLIGALASAFGEQFKQAAYLEIPLPDKRVDSFLNGRARVIESRNVLKECVKSLDLEKRWKLDEKAAIKSLAQKVSASREPNTDFLSIEVTGKTKNEAKELLDGILSSSISYFTRIERDGRSQYLEALNLQLQDQGDLVQDYRKAVSVLTQQYGVPYFENNRNQFGETELVLYREAQENLARLERERSLVQIQVRQLLDTANDDLVRLAAGLDLPDNQVDKYYQSYLSLTREVETLRESGLAAGHPEVKALQQKIEHVLDSAKKQVVGVKETLELNLSRIDKEVEAAKKEVKSRQDDALDRSLQLHNYNRVVREYEAARDLYEELSRQQQELRIEAKMPRHFQIHKIL